MKQIMKSIILAICLLATSSLAGQTDEYELHRDIPYYASSPDTTKLMEQRCRLDLYHPKSKGFATVVWFHGGGLKSGNKYVPAQLKNRNIAVAAINYRLSPTVKSPAYIEDAAASVAWIAKNVARYGGDPKAIFVAGHSAGGYLTSMVGLVPQYLAKHGIKHTDLAGLIPLSGQCMTHSTIRAERGLSRSRFIADELAPIHHLTKDSAPILLVTGDRELELWGRYEENAFMARLLKKTGHQRVVLHELDGFNHGNMVGPGCELLVQFVRKQRESLTPR